MTQAPISWASIPVVDIDRAQRFYEALLGWSLRRAQFGVQTVAVFPHAEGDAGGALVHGAGVPAPSRDGPVVYLRAPASLEQALARAVELGASVLMPRTPLPNGGGAIAQILDCEGNRIGLSEDALATA